jgi:hypothetical protein
MSDFAAEKGAIDLVNVHDVEYINVLDVEEGVNHGIRGQGADARHASCIAGRV